VGLADELQRLKELHDDGSLSDEEFAAAKASLLEDQSTEQPAHDGRPEPGASLGDAAKKWVNFQIVMAVIGLIIAAIFFFAFWLPQWNRVSGGRLP